MATLRYQGAAAILFCFLWSGAATAQGGPPDTMSERLRACAPCHGAQGEGTKDPYFPRLAGKPLEYLYNQLIAFRNGRRRYPPMNYLLAYLPESYLRQMAEHYAKLSVAPLPRATIEVSVGELARGETLARLGDAQHNVPACASCHGKEFTGMEPGIPGLLGLGAQYLSAQLGAWRYGTRTAPQPDCMQIVAGHLTEDDVRAVSAWLASRPMPEGSAPLPANSLSLPFSCGSVP